MSPADPDDDGAICPQPLANSVEDSVAQIQGWIDLQVSFRRGEWRCDDDAVAKRYSDFTMRMLAQHWRDIDLLARLVPIDPDFKKFVLHHIDDTWIPAELDLAIANATNRCPDNARLLCVAIREKAMQLRKADARGD